MRDGLVIGGRMTEDERAAEAVDLLICKDVPGYYDKAMMWWIDVSDEALARAIAKRMAEPLGPIGLAQALKWFADAWCDALMGRPAPAAQPTIEH